jgi:putative membrane protein
MHEINGMGWGMRLVWTLGLFLLAAIIWFIIRLVKENPSILKPRQKSAHDILNERYARGEIDKEEYQEKYKNIN